MLILPKKEGKVAATRIQLIHATEDRTNTNSKQCMHHVTVTGFQFMWSAKLVKPLKNLAKTISCLVDVVLL